MFKNIRFETEMPARSIRGASEYQRTCERCGNVWYVTLDDAKKPGKHRWVGNPRGLKLQSAGGGRQRAGAELRLARYAAEQDRYESGRRCSSCGSSAFREALV